MVINLNPGANKVNTEELQKETMETMKEYLGNLIPKMEGMVTELRTEVLEDTWEFLRMMVDGFNWVINAYNGCSDVINQGEQKINPEEIDTAISEFGKAFRDQDAEKTADSMEKDIIPFLKKLQSLI